MLRQLQKPLYSNCIILDPSGKPICRSGERRVNWYLTKGLATKVSDDPLTVKLNFTPAGAGDAGDEYMLANKDNKCVVCGSDNELTRHHVVPYCYRVHFPEKSKSHTSYDILPVCIDCHEAYEKEARMLRRQIIAELKIDEHGEIEIRREAVRAIKAAAALKRHGNKIPAEKIADLRSTIMNYFGKQECSDEDIEAAALLEWKIVPEDYACASKKVVESQESIDGFARRWREHFVSIMAPKHLPSCWSVDRKMYDEKTEAA